MHVPQSDTREARVPSVHRSQTGLVGLLVSSLSLSACCTDCARLSELGAASYSGPATTSGSKSQPRKQGASAGPSAQNKNVTLNTPTVPPPSGAAAVGSAFYVNPKGQLLTTWEEVRDCRKVAVLVDYEYRDATVMASNPLSGVAVLHAGISSSRHAVFRTADVSEGEEVSAFAHPILDGISLPLDVATGIVRRSTSPDGISGILQYSAMVDDGGAGGPIVDRQGDVVGIVVHPLSRAWPGDVGYGVSSSLILRFSAAAGVELWERATGSATAGPEGASFAGDYTVPVICFR